MRFMIMGDGLQTFTGKGGEKTVRRLLLLGADGDLSEQLCEFNLPASADKCGKGNYCSIVVNEVSGLFAGKPRLRGELLAVASTVDALQDAEEAQARAEQQERD